ncbi:MAG: NTP transferase domain-containing protein [Thermoleophilia bacterium]|nr:NTP transferase domain-containing protein [Thermoleophilia bacterium]
MTQGTVGRLRGDASGHGLPPAVVVLAAGQGSRLGPAGARAPKWLVPVEGTPIAHFHLRALRADLSAWSRLVAVTGHRSGAFDAARLSSLAGRPCELVHNEQYAACNNWLSLARALDHLEATRWTGAVCVLNSDLLLPPERLHALLADARRRPATNVLAIDSRRPLTEEAMKVVLAGEEPAVVDIGKGTLRGGPTAEFIGVSVLAAAHVPALRRILAAFEQDDARKGEWYEAAYREAIDAGVPFSAFEIATDDWVEIDDERDLRAAAAIAGRYGA